MEFRHQSGEWPSFLQGYKSYVFIEEPYDLITVPKGLNHLEDIEHIRREFRRMASAIAARPKLTTLLEAEDAPVSSGF